MPIKLMFYAKSKFAETSRDERLASLLIALIRTVMWTRVHITVIMSRRRSPLNSRTGVTVMIMIDRHYAIRVYEYVIRCQLFTEVCN